MEDLTFFALSSFAKDMEYRNFAMTEMKLLAEASYVPILHYYKSFPQFLPYFQNCQGFSCHGKGNSNSSGKQSLLLQ